MIGNHLLQQQTTQLHMTQQLVQSISLLQLSTMEFASFLEELAVENPLIEIESNFHSLVNPNDFMKQNRFNQRMPIETVPLGNGVTLYDHLREQLTFLPLSEGEKKRLHFLILNIDENGYLEMDIEEASALLNISVFEGKRILEIIQQMDPPGVGARNLQECLILQLKRKFPSNHPYVQILSRHFQKFVDKKWKDIVQEEGTTYQQLQQLFDEVQSLNPKPGSIFSKEQPSYVIPDVSIEKRGEKWFIQLNEDRYFRITFNDSYYEQLLMTGREELRKYMQKHVDQYHWIRKSMEQRRKTILSVVKEIIDRQELFLLGETDELKPLTMQEIADAINVHESTVSRTVKNKFIRTPVKTMPIRQLFSQRVENGPMGEDMSSDYIKHQLVSIIQGENKKKPYSDQEIVKILRTKDIHISRRTVAKYREQLNIPPSLKRKRFD
ncbi:RNA polymerase factor sigma-54 [Fervidibacillus halotolerans]|uniref:RNA polymerase factor sigma-54 n=1 Tax=Fervidibacillus halotolerans TaxID=2980027 RepID=A0A9E8LZ44_9BACI|nr:RNA polymerase factor sigma-54 [Fervidibacillus halotolerans]WAA11945.1 RNA polymerase factor sigma-54 [Fervidibacillus halotolerans]